jgi:hypothetical protein
MTPPINRVFTSLLLTALTVTLLAFLAGCATQAPVKDAEEVEEAPQTVWPAPPEQPRIRYIGSLQSLEDVAGKQKKSMRDILMGEEEKEEMTARRKPFGVHSDSKGRVFVADTGFAGLIVFDLEKEDVSFWGVTGPGALTNRWA